jgi:hypothetical protein
MSDFITNGATELPPVGDDGKVRAAVNWTVGDTYDIQQALLELRAGITGIFWDDLQVPGLSAGGASALVVEQYGDVTGMLLPRFSHNLDKTVSYPFQLPHRWIPNTEVRVHAHVIPMADPASDQVVKLSGKYAWAKYGTKVPANSAWTTFDVSLTVKNGEVEIPTIVPLFVTTPEGAKESDFLFVVLSRLGSTDAADTYSTAAATGTATANLTLEGFDLHFQTKPIKPGTVTEIPV